jgi:autotransporter adhesin
MKQALIALASVIALSAQAQTVVGTTNTNTIVQGASSTTVTSQYTTIKGGSQVTIDAPNTVVQGTMRVTGPINASSINLASPHGTLNVANEIVNNKDTVIRNNVASVDRDTDLDNRKADKTTVTSDIEVAKTDAVALANGYTDSEIEAAKQQANNVGSNSVAQSKAYTDQQINQVRKEVDGVGAMAMAASVSGSVTIEPGKSTAVTAAVGSYGGSKAIAVGVTHIVAPNQRVFATISRATGSKTGMAVGASFSF